MAMTWKRQPFEHQIEIADWHSSHINSLDLSEVGVGKTPPIIMVMDQMVKAGKISRILVIAPNSILDEWVKKLTDWSDLSFIVLRGPKQKREELLTEPWVTKTHCVYLINFEGVRVIYPLLNVPDKPWDLIVCDEIHHIKSHRAQQTKLILNLAKNTKARKGLTGTIITKDLEDVWAIAQFIDPRIFSTNFWGYRNRYMMNENANKSWLSFPKWVARPGAIEEVQKKLEPWAIRFEKRQVLKFLPPVLFEKRHVELSGEQARVYKELKKEFVAELDNSKEPLAALQILPRVTKLLEITSGFAYRDDQPPYRFKENAKLRELKAVLEEIGDRRVVIWCAFREDVEIICDFYHDTEMGGGLNIIHGDTPVSDRQAFVDQFNADAIQYLIANPACAGEGLTILAPYVIYYSRGWKLGERIQSLGRHDRPGSEQFENVTVIDLIAKDTVDERVLAALDAKENLLQSLNPRTAKEWMMA